MSAISLIDILAGSAGIAMALSPLLQARRVWQHQNAEAVSIPFLLVLSFGACVWLAYGIVHDSLPIILANGCNIVTTLSCIGISTYIRRRFS